MLAASDPADRSMQLKGGLVVPVVKPRLSGLKWLERKNGG